MSFGFIFEVLGFLFILYGLHEFYWLFVMNKLYKKRDMEEYADEDFFDYCCRRYDNLIWKFRKKMGGILKIIYHSRVFTKIIILKGIGLVLSGIIIFILLHYAYGTEYGGYLKFKY